MKVIIWSLVIFVLMSCGGETATKDTTAATPKATTTTNANQAAIAQQKAAEAKAAQLRKQAMASQANVKSTSLAEYKPKNEGWLVNLDEAYAESQKTGKPIMANFTGSDWCGWCKRLDKSVFHQADFDKWAKKNVVLLELDFPRRFRVPDEIAQQNRGLAQSFGVRGYPTIWLFDLDKKPDGQFNIEALGKTGYTKTLQEFQTTMEGYMAARG